MSGINQLTDIRKLQLQHSTAVSEKGKGSNFSEMIQEEQSKNQGVKFSKHAEERICQRGMVMSDGLLNNLNQAVEKARTKGAKDTVVIGAQGAFVVNVPNNIVVTTMTQQEMKENIFTNIDSAVLM